MIMINKKFKRLIKLMDQIWELDGEQRQSIICHGDVCKHIVNYMTYDFGNRGEIDDAIFRGFVQWHKIFEEDFTNEKIEEFESTAINAGILNYDVISALFDEGDNEFNDLGHYNSVNIV